MTMEQLNNVNLALVHVKIVVVHWIAHLVLLGYLESLVEIGVSVNLIIMLIHHHQMFVLFAI